MRATSPRSIDCPVIDFQDEDRPQESRGSTSQLSCPPKLVYNSPQEHVIPSSTSEVLVLEPGLVLLRNFVSDTECQELAKMALTRGREEGGFFTTLADGSEVLNTGEAGRGRIYDAARNFPKAVSNHCARAVREAQNADRHTPEMTCTHILLNMYTNSDGLVWHRDIYENDGRSDHPVVNLCVGASCKFGYKHQDNDADNVISLHSGDVLIFGGRCRLIKHAVLDVMLDQCPEWMKDCPLRFSFTFRDSPEVLGREKEFKYFKVTEHLVGQDEFVIPKDSKSFTGLPSMTSQEAHEV